MAGSPPSGRSDSFGGLIQRDSEGSAAETWTRGSISVWNLPRPAIDLFTERGYRETTIAAIADAADVGIRTVTGHFPTKGDLVFADEPFAAASLAMRLAARQGHEQALDAFRD